jgi:hypothetical protein
VIGSETTGAGTGDMAAAMGVRGWLVRARGAGGRGVAFCVQRLHSVCGRGGRVPSDLYAADDNIRLLAVEAALDWLLGRTVTRRRRRRRAFNQRFTLTYVCL